MTWSSVGITAGAGAVAGAILLAIYALAHRRVPVVYRRGLDTALSPVSHGMDVACLVRFVRLLARLSLWWAVVGSVFLIPTYAYAGGGTPDPFSRYTLANVPAGSRVFYAAAVAAWLNFGIAAVFVTREYARYAEERIAYLSDTNSQHAYSVVIERVPLHLQEPQLVRRRAETRAPARRGRARAEVGRQGGPGLLRCVRMAHARTRRAASPPPAPRARRCATC
jgi:hypothetical protein